MPPVQGEARTCEWQACLESASPGFEACVAYSVRLIAHAESEEASETASGAGARPAKRGGGAAQASARAKACMWKESSVRHALPSAVYTNKTHRATSEPLPVAGRTLRLGLAQFGGATSEPTSKSIYLYLSKCTKKDTAGTSSNEQTRRVPKFTIARRSRHRGDTWPRLLPAAQPQAVQKAR